MQKILTERGSDNRPNGAGSPVGETKYCRRECSIFDLKGNGNKNDNLGKEHNNSAFYMQLALTRPPEIIADMVEGVINQTTFLFRQQIIAFGEAYIIEGGFRERMSRMRLEQ